MSSEMNRMDGNERFRQLVKSENVKILSKLLSELGLLESRKLIQECYRDEPEPAVIQYVKKAAGASLTKHEEILDCCKLLLKYGADVNEMSYSKKTALHLACRLGDEKMVKLLLEHGADPSIMDGSGFNSLHLAVHSGAVECVRLILGRTKELINAHDAHGAAPVLTAVQKGDNDLLNVLVTSGGDVNIQEVTSKRSPLHYALYLQNKEIFQYLLNNGADLTRTDHRETNIVHRCCAVSEPWYLEQILSSSSPNTKKALKMEDGEGATPVIVACQNGNIEQLRRLVESGAPVANKDKFRRCALHHCAENTDTRCAEYILRSIPSLMTCADEEGLTPLHMAVIAGNIPLIKLLLKRGANLKAVDNEKHTVAHWATVCGHADVLDVLLENGAELDVPDKHHAFPVHYAAQMVTSSGASQMILKTLLSNSVSVEAEDKDKRTPIIWAASAGSSQACTILVEFGADVNRADKDDLTALHCASSRGQTACVETLVKNCNADLDPVDKNQCTPLFYAATLGHIECLKKLLDLGADSCRTDTRGRTVAHCAVVSGSTEALQVLSDYNIDLWTRNLKGDQPIHEAAQSGHIDILLYLLEHSPDHPETGHQEAIDTANGDGRTCLHIAALTNNLWLCKTLLAKNAHVNAVMTNKGKYYTPFDVALIKGHNDIKDLLVGHGARPGSVIVDQAAESIQVKYRYHKKQTQRDIASTVGDNPSKSEQQKGSDSSINLEVQKLVTVDENDYSNSLLEDRQESPRYVDKSTQIRTKPINKNSRNTVDESVASEQSISADADKSTLLLQPQESKPYKSLTDSLSSSSQVLSSGPKGVLSKQRRIRASSHSEERETPSEKSTSHGNTSDVESSGADPIQRKSKVKKSLKIRNGKVLNKSQAVEERSSSRIGTTSVSLPSLSEESHGQRKCSSFDSFKGHNCSTSATSQELNESDSEKMGCSRSAFAKNNSVQSEPDKKYTISEGKGNNPKKRAQIPRKRNPTLGNTKKYRSGNCANRKSRRKEGSPGKSPNTQRKITRKETNNNSLIVSSEPVQKKSLSNDDSHLESNRNLQVVLSEKSLDHDTEVNNKLRLEPDKEFEAGFKKVNRETFSSQSDSSHTDEDDQKNTTVSQQNHTASEDSEDSSHKKIRKSNHSKNTDDTKENEVKGHSPRKKKSARNMVQSVQASVRRYEQERKSIRQLHQLKRTLLYSGPTKNNTVFRKVPGPHRNNSPDRYHQDQGKHKQSSIEKQSASANGHGASSTDQSTWSRNHSKVHKRKTEQDGLLTDQYSKSLDETSPRKMVHETEQRRPHTNLETRRLNHYSGRLREDNGYYDDPRLSTSLKAIKRRKELAQMQLIKAYQPFGGIEIFTNTSIFQTNSRSPKRPSHNAGNTSSSSKGKQAGI
ncbi:E3 ubiquitin-protein ligase Topors [Biomphalaria pfeifferi]|uniref:E3 ubiquitin-protein ligase Topors n=1 Tax=Biomphalaria pfeifferi TaxID=112525 RepID=A0AAD8BAI7_BIOPF|nr:E3 ubiquitin-protein ligase Topors [Biomphalaria pfeifferi]